jgi:hypothetical protein
MPVVISGNVRRVCNRYIFTYSLVNQWTIINQGYQPQSYPSKWGYFEHVCQQISIAIQPEVGKLFAIPVWQRNAGYKEAHRMRFFPIHALFL